VKSKAIPAMMAGIGRSSSWASGQIKQKRFVNFPGNGRSYGQGLQIKEKKLVQSKKLDQSNLLKID
jgi:hypothetical protein